MRYYDPTAYVLILHHLAGILYMIGQLAGSAVAGGVLRGSFGKARSIA